MSDSSTGFGPLSPRKEPAQARSRARVENILKITSELLVTEGLEKLSTNRIAKAAGMPIGSLYQYFPNKQAIIHELYCRWLDGLYGAFHQIAEMDLSQFTIDQLVDYAFKQQYMSAERGYGEFELQLSKAVSFYPELEEIDEKDGRRFAALIADILKKVGLKASDEELLNLGFYIYSLNESVEAVVRRQYCSVETAVQFHKQACATILRSYL